LHAEESGEAGPADLQAGGAASLASTKARGVRLSKQERAYLDDLYKKAWDAFLVNRRDAAEQRALAGLQKISMAGSNTDADLLITEADLAYIAGNVACRSSIKVI
jgi:hypothetical protein